ncbi:ABC-type transporter ATP-binding protein EcsA [Gemella morbillorum]|uniref:ABC transporter ATP-binding protein n=1 Tax=Gemella morbillorum TaxID=29391 RepID=UPI000DA41D0B|nr:ABC transporter ATP-binding protein [Gemella morbillorum]UBH80229.1 ABC transporter ATP-binding protein [Gemella morbillorum]SQH55614.1 ABC-type transporter ATP-binding protein EcsA [Gemella morbillorum]
MTQVLKIENLSGGYNRKKIIENINIEIPKGSITALIGLNGAGKSTTIKHILGLLRPMDGEIKVNGITIRENNEKYRKSISYIPESPVLYDELTLEEHINLTAMAYGLNMKEAWQKADVLLKLFKLSDKKKFFPVHFSKGMKQKVMIICSFLVEPNLYIIDEPFLGLDPIAINDLINLMCEKRDNGASILMSTHILATAEKYCDNFIIIHEGKILASGKLSYLRKEFNMADASLDEIYLALTTRGQDE